MSTCIYIYLIIVPEIQSFFSRYPDNLTRNNISGAPVDLFIIYLNNEGSGHFGRVFEVFFKKKDAFFMVVPVLQIFY
jgi:hypothetical protein